jgi:hypothetical protein
MLSEHSNADAVILNIPDSYAVSKNRLGSLSMETTAKLFGENITALGLELVKLTTQGVVTALLTDNENS